jgi:hypothetical protein
VQIYKQTGVLVRGLCHPSPLANTPAFSHTTNSKLPASRDPLTRSKLRQSREGGGSNASDNGFGSFLTLWGAVPVGPLTLFRLLKNGECVLLFPGGATEVSRCTQLLRAFLLSAMCKVYCLFVCENSVLSSMPRRAIYGRIYNSTACFETCPKMELFKSQLPTYVRYGDLGTACLMDNLSHVYIPVSGVLPEKERLKHHF